MDSVFYRRFERHAHGEGLKAHATHYCPGCGHGLVHKYLADAIAALGVQDRTVAVSPVGCAVFLHYYLDVGNTQAAHGRAPAVAIGHKMANPEAVVVSYQGDGDLASIGLAEILQAAQMGLPITVIFVNNAIYGMTGGQMAPTTLLGQRTTTTPDGRPKLAGEPLKVAEMIGGLDGPVYVERVALYDAKQRVRAEKAIHKALRLQVEGRGFALVEVLAECPTHLKATPADAERWVKEVMVPVFPLGVVKDEVPEPWFALEPPSFDPARVLAVLHADRPRAEGGGDAFPAHLDPEDVSVKLAGAGGDGPQTAAMLLCKAAIDQGWDGTYIPSYGPESRGGTSYADVHVAASEVLSPASPDPHVLIAFNAPSVEKFAPTVRPGGFVIYDTTVVPTPPKVADGVTVLGLPLSEIAVGLGKRLVKNVVALGALQEATGMVPMAALDAVLARALAGNDELLAINRKALEAGREAAAVRLGAEVGA